MRRWVWRLGIFMVVFSMFIYVFVAGMAMQRQLDHGWSCIGSVTSPPYYGLRAYLPAGHPDKAKEIGRGRFILLTCSLCGVLSVGSAFADEAELPPKQSDLTGSNNDKEESKHCHRIMGGSDVPGLFLTYLFGSIFGFWVMVGILFISRRKDGGF